jgi:hypothetical protein
MKAVFHIGKEMVRGFIRITKFTLSNSLNLYIPVNLKLYPPESNCSHAFEAYLLDAIRPRNHKEITKMEY